MSAALIEELEAASLVGLTAPEGAARWTEDQIQRYFESDGEETFPIPPIPAPAPAAPAPAPAPAPGEAAATAEASITVAVLGVPGQQGTQMREGMPQQTAIRDVLASLGTAEAMEPMIAYYKARRCQEQETLADIGYESGSLLLLKSRLGANPPPAVHYASSAEEIDFSADPSRVYIIRNAPFEQLDAIYEQVTKRHEVRAEAKNATFGREKLSRHFKTGNGEGTSNNPILPHNEGFYHAASGHCFFYMHTCAPFGGENMLVPNAAMRPAEDQSIEEYFYLTRDWLPFQLKRDSPYPEPLMPYSITWFDQGVYDEFVLFLASRGLIPGGVSCDAFEQHIAQIGKMQDYPVSPIRRQLSPHNLATFRSALEQSLVLNLKPGDLLVFDNEQYMHARPPYQGPRKLVVAFSQKPRFLLPEWCQTKIRGYIKDKSYETKALGLEDNHTVLKYEEEE
eukprot:TRINITY_DN11829_c0_g1_i2.p1 TRINITY_DN11829_c0_g1~~TRINITY_DN11829_c0_g1_i2.p1  ORF type:complete len:452 (+),score=97.37 TRINITY_DN11829_c0_g1_i2:187-1542(+)